MATKVENCTKVEGDEVLLSKGYGYADLENEIPMPCSSSPTSGI